MKTEPWVLIDVACCGDPYPIAASFGGHCAQCGERPTPVGKPYVADLDVTPVRSDRVALTPLAPPHGQHERDFGNKDAA